MPIKKKLQEKITDAKRIEFAKQIELFYEVSHADMKKIALGAFVKGVATGLGVFLGGTIIVSLLVWLLSLLPSLPFVGNISKAAEKSIEQTTQQ
ncbi:MAG TPA: DUF5665 domain-containing protein [Candidatus Saccharimonadales bacterium]|nr:DUF5665 domain-containing protein [Candidatus Saccharimonadales bacterium]